MGFNIGKAFSSFFSPGESKSESQQALSPEGMRLAKSMQESLASNPYAKFTGAAPTMNLNAMGLTEGQQGGFEEAIRQAMSQLSGGGAQRGFLNPEYAPALAASSAKQVMPQFAPLISQNLSEQFGQNMGNQQFIAGLEQNRVNQGLNLLGNYRAASSKGDQQGQGLGYNLVSNFANNWSGGYFNNKFAPGNKSNNSGGVK